MARAMLNITTTDGELIEQVEVSHADLDTTYGRYFIADQIKQALDVIRRREETS